MDETASSPPAPIWAKVEILGHRTRCGAVTEVEQFGIKMLRIDVYRLGEVEPCLTEEYSAATALFGMTRCTEEYARAWAGNRWNLPEEARLALPAPTDPEPTDADFDILDRDADEDDGANL